MLAKKHDIEYRLLNRGFMRQKSSNPFDEMKLIIELYSLVNTVGIHT